MTTIRVDWEGADDGERAEIQKHLNALRESGANVVEADADALVRGAAQAICDHLAGSDKGEGEAVDRAIAQARLPAGPLNARQRGVLDEALSHLGRTGIIEQGRDGKIRLTKIGCEHLYP